MAVKTPCIGVCSTGLGDSQSTEDFGFSLKPNWQRFSLEEIKQFLEQDFYALSTAHYDRYMTRI